MVLIHQMLTVLASTAPSPGHLSHIRLDSLMLFITSYAFKQTLSAVNKQACNKHSTLCKVPWHPLGLTLEGSHVPTDHTNYSSLPGAPPVPSSSHWLRARSTHDTWSMVRPTIVLQAKPKYAEVMSSHLWYAAASCLSANLPGSQQF